jgi:hypothetical protein
MADLKTCDCCKEKQLKTKIFSFKYGLYNSTVVGYTNDGVKATTTYKTRELPLGESEITLCSSCIRKRIITN